ncbi:MAG: L,D-transpeptidase family protein [Pseudomonadota bacterium]
MLYRLFGRSTLTLLIVVSAACVAHRPLELGEAASGPDDSARAPRPATAPTLVIRAEESPTDTEAEVSAWANYLSTGSEREPLIALEFVLASAEQNVVGELQVVRSRSENTFSDIARTFGLGYDELANANPGVDPWLPGDATPILLPTRFVLPDAPREGVVLNIAAKRLFYYPTPAAGEAQRVITYPIGIGRVGWATPVGSSKVIAKAENPTWYVPRSVREEHRAMGDPLPAVVPPGPDNPLGHRVLKLDLEGYLIHGTNQPYGVGMRVSHGCVRLYPEHIEALYGAVGLGTPVHIVNQPLLAAHDGDDLVVQAYPALEDDERDAGTLHAPITDKLESLADGVQLQRVSARINALIAEGSGLATVVTTDTERAPDERWPRLVANNVVVDNPLSDDEVAEAMALADEAEAISPNAGD